jgi:hypothetical protein
MAENTTMITMFSYAVNPNTYADSCRLHKKPLPKQRANNISQALKFASPTLHGSVTRFATYPVFFTVIARIANPNTDMTLSNTQALLTINKNVGLPRSTRPYHEFNSQMSTKRAQKKGQ